MPKVRVVTPQGVVRHLSTMILPLLLGTDPALGWLITSKSPTIVFVTISGSHKRQGHAGSIASPIPGFPGDSNI